MTGAEAVAHALHDAVADTVFGLPGAHNLALWPACERAGVRIVGMRSEQGCAFAADGFARVTGKAGAALVTTGPGAANTVGAVGEAWASRSRVAVIATDIPTTLRRAGSYRGVLHECTDQAAMFAPVVKASYDLSDASDIDDALCELNRAPARPVYIGVPYDLLASPVSDRVPRRVAHSATPLDLAPFMHALQRSERPLIWAGGGARDDDDAIERLATRLGAPVITTYQARGVLPPDHPLLVPAPPHEPEVTELVERADLAIVVGSDLDQMTTMQWRLPLPERRIAINIDPKDATKNYSFEMVLPHPASVARTIAVDAPERSPWAGDLVSFGRAIRTRLAADGRTRDALAFLQSTESALPAEEHAVFADMCIPGYWIAGHLRVPRPRALHYPMGWGTLGFALPAAIGASLAMPTLAFVGDGGALFALGELSALAALGTPCTIVIVDDGGYGMLRHGAHSTPANDLPAVDFIRAAEAFGIPGTRVEGVGREYAAALAAAIAAREPRVVHVRAALNPPVTTTPYWPIGAPR